MITMTIMASKMTIIKKMTETIIMTIGVLTI